MPANDVEPYKLEHVDAQDSNDTLSWSCGWWLGNARKELSL
jgi:hypothetical protein